MRQKEIKKEEIKKFIVHKEQKFSLVMIKGNNKPVHVQPVNRKGQNETERNKERRNKKVYST